jgi:hypothetical protein
VKTSVPAKRISKLQIKITSSRNDPGQPLSFLFITAAASRLHASILPTRAQGSLRRHVHPTDIKKEILKKRKDKAKKKKKQMKSKNAL